MYIERKDKTVIPSINSVLFCRFVGTGWAGAKAWDMVQVYHSIPASERQRVEHLEFLDEQELLTQLFQHYCVCTAWHGQLFEDIDIS